MLANLVMYVHMIKQNCDDMNNKIKKSVNMYAEVFQIIRY